MHAYPKKSRLTAARILALTTLADGNISAAEMATLDRLDADKVLGMDRTELHAVMQSYCESLLMVGHLCWADASSADSETLASLLAELQEPDLRLKVLQLCVAVVESDGAPSDAESKVLRAMAEHWGLQSELPSSGSAGA